MKNNRKLFACLICIISVCLLMSACSGGGETDTEGENEAETEEVFVPAVDKGEESDQYSTYEEYYDKASLAFVGIAPLAPENFEYGTEGGEVTIKKYIGDEIVVVIPESIDGAAVTAIAEGAFSGGAVRSVYVPDSVRSIAKNAFDRCEGLATLRLPFVGDGGENTHFGYIFGADEPDENAVKVPTSLTLCIFGKGVSSVRDEAFRRVKSLKAVSFEGEIESVGKLAFYECAELSYITLEKVTGNIGEYAFAFCRALYSADVSNAQTAEKGAFYACSSLHDISLTFGENDFLGRFFGAESADFNDEFVPSSLRVVKIGEKCKKIPDRAFSSCKYLTEVKLHDGLEAVGVRAFYSCRSLASVRIPDAVVTVGDDAFFNCDALKHVSFGDSLREIGMQAFFGCLRLSSLEFPERLEKIGAYAFFGCEALEEAVFNGREEIGKDAFGNCPKLNTQN